LRGPERAGLRRERRITFGSHDQELGEVRHARLSDIASVLDAWQRVVALRYRGIKR